MIYILHLYPWGPIQHLLWSMASSLHSFRHTNHQWFTWISARRRRKNIDSLSKSNPLSRRRKKSRRIFNKNYCDFLTAITHTKILAAYFIISDKKLKYKWRITAARPTHYFVGILFLCFWATVCNMVRPMLSDHCLSVCPVCLSVTLMHCGHGGRPRPRPHCFR